MEKKVMNKNSCNDVLADLKYFISQGKMNSSDVITKLLNKGCLYEGKGNFYEAATMYNMATEIDTNDPKSNEAHEKRLHAIEKWLKQE